MTLQNQVISGTANNHKDISVKLVIKSLLVKKEKKQGTNSTKLGESVLIQDPTIITWDRIAKILINYRLIKVFKLQLPLR